MADISKKNKETPDKFQATWVSHSKMKDFLNCPRLYYLRYVYKNPLTGKKLSLMEPPLALGQAVHEVLENLTNYSLDERLKIPLVKQFEENWDKNYSGQRGGFKNQEKSDEYKMRGIEMIKRVLKNPGPVANKTIKLKSDFADLPYYWISEEENIILCGKIDWIEYLEEKDAVHIVDFKTGLREESEDSLQLPVYLLLVANKQKRKVDKVSYWYISKSDTPQEQTMPSMKESKEEVIKIAKRIKLANQLDHFKCNQNGCRHCSKYEEIMANRAKRVGENSYQDIYVLV